VREAIGTGLDEQLIDIERRWRQGKRLCRQVLEVHVEATRLLMGGERPQFKSIREMLDGLRPDQRSGAKTTVGVTMDWISHRLREVADTPTYFELAEALALRLAATELRGVRSEDVRLPFHAFAAVLPDQFVQVWNDQTGWHDGTLLVVAEGYWAPDHRWESVIHGRRIVFGIYGEPNENSANPQDDALITFSVPFADGTALGETISAHQAPEGPAFRVHDGTELSWADSMRHWTHFVANLALYLSSPDNDCEHKWAPDIRRLADKKDKVSRERSRRLKSQRTYIVGHRLRLAPGEREALRSGDRASVAYQSLVRGHWRNQAYGEGRALRKMMWIVPHVRRKELGGVLGGNEYKVTE
jgi:hypothetical protein